jgi:E3 ubiquitin-protein ligase EDD1
MDRDGSGSNNNQQPSSATVSLNISDSATLNVISSDSGSNIASIQQPQTSQATPQQSSKKLNPIVVLDDCQIDDNAPLFYQPEKANFYSPRQGYPTCERINAFRNVGRLIGLCLLQNELLPIFLQRHVLKFILRRQIRFHDLAFFDPIVYESLRQLVKDTQSKNGAQLLQSLELVILCFLKIFCNFALIKMSLIDIENTVFKKLRFCK